MSDTCTKRCACGETLVWRATDPLQLRCPMCANWHTNPFALAAIPLPARITISVPREMSDARVTDMRAWAADIQTVFGIPTVVQRPYGVTYQQWDALAADAYHMPDRTVPNA